MSAHPLDGKHLLQGADQHPQGMFLLRCPRIRGQTIRVQPAFIRYPYTFPVVSQAMSPLHLQRSGAPDESVFPDVEVIPHHPHSPCLVTTEQILLSEIGIHPCSRAVHHYQGNTPSYPTHADTPRAPANAEATAMITFKMISHVLFFFPCSLLMLYTLFKFRKINL